MGEGRRVTESVNGDRSNPEPILGVTDRYLIGLTGNIATGKSTVAAILSELGATVIDADKIVHHLMWRGSELHEKVVAAFGRDVVGTDGEIDRKRLGRIVFSNPAELRRLEKVVHPAAAVEVRQRVENAETAVVVIEAIKLIEAGWHRVCQALWVTTCPAEHQIDRLMKGRSLSYKEAQQRVTAQPPQIEKVRLADVVIDTSGDLAETRRQVEVAWQASDTGGSHAHTRSVHGLSS
jgi:dephospho-CoA kinase